MRKTTFARPLSCCGYILCLAALSTASIPLFTQDATPAAAPAKEAPTSPPSDPKELLLLAARSNGLAGDDIKPWHIKATYKSFDEQGNVKDQGIYEESWVSPKKFKRTFTGTAFSQTEYGTENGILVAGAPNPGGNTAAQLRGEFIGPMPSPESIQRTSFDLKPREVGGVSLACLSPITSEGVHFGTTWCLDASKPILRAEAPQQGPLVVHNIILRFQGRYIAQDLQFIQSSKTVMTAHLDSIEQLGTIDEALFLPSPDATPKRISITVAGGVMAGMLLKAVQPGYPLYAKDAKITGTVVLQAIINKDGHIANLHVISGPSELQQASLEAVKHWIYRPYLLNGEPVEVQTTINVVFALNR